MDKSLAQALSLIHGLTFRAGAFRFQVETVGGDRIHLVVDDAANSGRHRREMMMRCIPAGAEADHAAAFDDVDLPVLVIYPRSRRHPMGAQAPVSWLNESGYGLIAIASKDMLMNVTVDGIVSDVVVAVGERSRGRPNGSALWMAATSLALPINLTRRQLVDATGFSGFTADEWLAQAVSRGWLKVSPSQRNRRFTATKPGLQALGEFVEAKWGEWRGGRHPDRQGPPMRRYFLARASLERYQELAVKAKQRVDATGISVLEQRGGLVQTSPVREVAFITTMAGLAEITAQSNVQLSETRETPGASEATLLDPGHPLLGIVEQRCIAERDPWPLGLAALDAFDHPNARVAQLAKEQWRRWLDEIQTIDLDAFSPGR